MCVNSVAHWKFFLFPNIITSSQLQDITITLTSRHTPENFSVVSFRNLVRTFASDKHGIPLASVSQASCILRANLVADTNT